VSTWSDTVHFKLYTLKSEVNYSQIDLRLHTQKVRGGVEVVLRWTVLRG